MTEQKPKKVEKINLDQALNLLKIIGRNRTILTNKFSEQSKSESDWRKEFKNKGIDF